jgi:hypothetical protein
MPQAMDTNSLGIITSAIVFCSAPKGYKLRGRQSLGYFLLFTLTGALLPATLLLP